jgi:hypothetical protein
MVKPPPIPQVRKEAKPPPLPKPKIPQPPPLPPEALAQRPIRPVQREEIFDMSEHAVMEPAQKGGAEELIAELLASSPPPVPEDVTVKPKSGKVHPRYGLQISKALPIITVEGLKDAFGGKEEEILGEVTARLRRTYGGVHFKRAAEESERPGIPRPGGLVVHDDQIPVIAFGDFHGNYKRMNAALNHKYMIDGKPISLKELLKNKKGAALFMGDLIHWEGGNIDAEAYRKMTDIEIASLMAASKKVLDAAIMLSYLHEGQVIYLRGNHERIYSTERLLEGVLEYVFRPPKGKRFIQFLLERNYIDEVVDKEMLVARESDVVPQGLYFLFYLCAYYRYVKKYTLPDVRNVIHAYQEFIDNLPVAAKVKGKDRKVLYLHAGGVKGGVTEEQLVNALGNEELQREILFNKRNKGDYKREDVEATRIKNDVTDVVGAHEIEEDDWISHPFGDPNFHVIHSNVGGNPEPFGALVMYKGELTPERIDVNPSKAAAVNA